MERGNNYLLQAEQAKHTFLTYDQEALIRKFRLEADDVWLYPRMLGAQYRLNRKTGDLQRLADGQWADANTHSEVMTLLDLLCDSREDRCLSGSWKTMQAFGNQVHSGLLEETGNPVAAFYAAHLPAFKDACRALGGIPVPMGDVGFGIELFDGLRIAPALWLADEDFPASIRFFWDSNALMYLRYETMYFAVNLLEERIREAMAQAENTRAIDR